MVYNVWLEIEEADYKRDRYQTLDAPGAALATFGSYEEAFELVETLATLTGQLGRVVPKRRSKIKAKV